MANTDGRRPVVWSIQINPQRHRHKLKVCNRASVSTALVKAERLAFSAGWGGMIQCIAWNTALNANALAKRVIRSPTPGLTGKLR
jgi:hypothetical protein